MRNGSFLQARKEETMDEERIFSSSEKGIDSGCRRHLFLKRERKRLRTRKGSFLQARMEETVDEEVSSSSSEK